MKVPPKTVGLFGVPKAWLRVVEGQYWLILHAHFLIWIYVHVDIRKRLQQAISRDKLLLEPVDRNSTDGVLGNYFTPC
jgi:hypothetical protein